jgi:hypothetical protein
MSTAAPYNITTTAKKTRALKTLPVTAAIPPGVEVIFDNWNSAICCIGVSRGADSFFKKRIGRSPVLR